VGWIYQYALVDRSGRWMLSQLRALQDWFLKYELKTVPNVAEVASVGGMVRQYQVLLDPDKLAAYNVRTAQVIATRSATPTRKPAARCWNWARPSTWCAPRAT
jgi:Cu(I)/Ag(I) efflux system membrane protein CusA/SilA